MLGVIDDNGDNQLVRLSAICSFLITHKDMLATNESKLVAFQGPCSAGHMLSSLGLHEVTNTSRTLVKAQAMAFDHVQHDMIIFHASSTS